MGSSFSGQSGVYHWSPLESIEAHGSPLELEIVYEVKSNLIKKFLTIGAHWSPLEFENSDGINIFWTQWCLPLDSIGVGEFRWDQNFLDTVVFTIGAHLSPLELEIVDEGKSK